MQPWVLEMLQHQEENQTLLKEIDRELRYAPKGNLQISHYRGAARYYRNRKSEGKGKEYLGEKKAALRDALAQKAYDLELRKAVEQEQELIQSVGIQIPQTPIEVYEALPEEIRAMVEPLVLPDEEYIERWLKIMSEKASGEDYRSRVEVIYHNIYEKYEIPYVYEPSLHLDGYGPARPDFAVLNVRTRQTLYHEHFGMMDDEEYRNNNIWKLRCYHKNGYYEGINFFVTMESDGRMIDYEEAEQIVKKYCL